MARIEGTVFCDNCGAEITWSPVIVEKHDYCCQDCFEGRPCDCGDRMDIEDERRKEATTSGVPTTYGW